MGDICVYWYSQNLALYSMGKSKTTVEPMHSTQTCDRVEEQLHSCLISAIYGDEWYKCSTSKTPVALFLREDNPKITE